MQRRRSWWTLSESASPYQQAQKKTKFSSTPQSISKSVDELVFDSHAPIENDEAVEWLWEKEALPQQPEKDIPPLKTKTAVLNLKTPVDYWLHMFTNSNVEQITVETNRYMNEKSPNNKDVITSDDIKSVYGILIYMSVIKLTKMHR